MFSFFSASKKAVAAATGFSVGTTAVSSFVGYLYSINDGANTVGNSDDLGECVDPMWDSTYYKDCSENEDEKWAECCKQAYELYMNIIHVDVSIAAGIGAGLGLLIAVPILARSMNANYRQMKEDPEQRPIYNKI